MDGGWSVLCWVRLPSGESRIVDTLNAFAGYEELTWSPDSRALVATRVTETEHHGEVLASDIWLFEWDGQRCRLTDTKDFIESEPKWIDSTTILYSRRATGEPDNGRSERRVMTIRPTNSNRTN